MVIDRRNLCLCVLVTLLAILVAWPFAEGSYIDDFSSIHMAQSLAETGRFAYNGWPTAMLGIQIWWGAAWIWLFGFSFTLVRLSVLPLALGAVALVYRIARRASLSPADSLFAALPTGLSTLFLPLVPTCRMTTQTRSFAKRFPPCVPTSWWSTSGRSRRATAATSRGFPSRPGGVRRTGARS
jgi:hypothetical protein